MKLIIDIPDEEYSEFIKADKNGYCARMIDIKAIKNGTPLPEGHGRLIDADEIQFENTEFETYGDYCIAFDAIDNAPTIIEANTDAEWKESEPLDDVVELMKGASE